MDRPRAFARRWGHQKDIDHCKQDTGGPAKLSAADYLDVVAALDVREDDLLEVVELGDVEQASDVFGVGCEIFPS